MLRHPRTCTHRTCTSYPPKHLPTHLPIRLPLKPPGPPPIHPCNGYPLEEGRLRLTHNLPPMCSVRRAMSRRAPRWGKPRNAPRWVQSRRSCRGAPLGGGVAVPIQNEVCTVFHSPPPTQPPQSPANTVRSFHSLVQQLEVYR